MSGARGIACLLVAGVTVGCGAARLPPMTAQQRVNDRLDHADAFARAGRYTDARDGYVTILEGSKELAGADRALLGLARLAFHPENPGKDDRQAARYLDRLLRDYPQSAWAMEARTWRDLFEKLDRLQGDMRVQRHELERLRRELQREQQETVRLRQEREHLRQIDLEYERPISVGPTTAQPRSRMPRE
jgi:hypothetical protein